MNAEFFHHLHNTIILLGGGTRIADMVKRYPEVTDSDLDELQHFNHRLISSTKGKLANLTASTVHVRKT